MSHELSSTKQNPTSTVNISIASRETWMSSFHNTFPPYVVEDDAATTFESCAAIVLSSLRFGSENPRVLADLTALPLGFVYLVCEKAAQTNFWQSERMVDLAGVLSQNTPDPGTVLDFLQSAMEGYWENAWSLQFVLVLECLRDGILVGGERQGWVDTGFEQEFETL